MPTLREQALAPLSRADAERLLPLLSSGRQTVERRILRARCLKYFESFDLAWAELVFHHVPVEITDKYLREIARVLKPGGRFVCQLPLKDFYKLHSRDVCGWLTLAEARQLMDRYFDDVQVNSDGRHIVGLVVKA